MRKYIILGLFFIVQSGFAQEELILFDQFKKPVAYLFTEKNDWFFYDFSGEGLAKLEFYGEENQVVFGRNGRHLGWFSEGWLYDVQGYVVGFLEGALPIRKFKVPQKKKRSVFIWEGTQDHVRIINDYKHQWSALTLEEYFFKGTEKIKRASQPIVLPNKDRKWYKI